MLTTAYLTIFDMNVTGSLLTRLGPGTDFLKYQI